MTPQEMEIAYNVAREFHKMYEELAPMYGYETRRESAVAWEDLPESNKLLMVGVVAKLLDKGVIRVG